MWLDRILGNHIGTLPGFAFSSDHFNDIGEGLPLIRIRDIESTTTVTHYSGLYQPAFLISEGDILVGMDGEFNLRRWRGDKALLNQRVLKVFAKPASEIDLDFAYHWLAPFLKKVEAITAATTVKHLSSKDIERAVVRSPPKEEQKTIALILSALNTQIEATEALIAKQERVRAGLMQDLFTRGVDEDGRLRPPREEAPHLYHQTELGWLPKGWEVSGLKGKGPINGGHLKTGPFGSSLKIEHWVSQGRPVITIGSLGEGILEHKELLYVSDETATRLEAYQLAPGDVVFSRVADVGRSVVIEPENSGWIMSSNLMRIRLDATKVKPHYLHLQLAFNAVLRTQVRRSINSGGRDVANAAVLNSLKLAWPTRDEQDQIIEAAGKMDAQSGFLKEGLLKLRLQKSGLMQDLLTGKVSVAPLLEGVAA